MDVKSQKVCHMTGCTFAFQLDEEFQMYFADVHLPPAIKCYWCSSTFETEQMAWLHAGVSHPASRKWAQDFEMKATPIVTKKPRRGQKKVATVVIGAVADKVCPLPVRSRRLWLNNTGHKIIDENQEPTNSKKRKIGTITQTPSRKPKQSTPLAPKRSL